MRSCINKKRKKNGLVVLLLGVVVFSGNTLAAVPSDLAEISRTQITATADDTSGGYVPSRTIDGSTSTQWITYEMPQAHWLQFDLGVFFEVRGFEIYSSNYRPKGYEVYVTDDVDVWGSAVTNGEFLNSSAWQFCPTPPSKGRYLILNITNGYSTTTLYVYEVKTYASRFTVANQQTGSIRVTNTDTVDVVRFLPPSGYDRYQVTETDTPPVGGWTDTNTPPTTVTFSVPDPEGAVTLYAWFTNATEAVALTNYPAQIVYTTVLPIPVPKATMSRWLAPGVGTATVSAVEMEESSTGGEASGIAMSVYSFVSAICTNIPTCDETPGELYVTITNTGTYHLNLVAMNEAGNIATSAATCEVTVDSMAASGTRYVVTSNFNANWPYTRWEAAATNMQVAVDAALDDELICIQTGTYSRSSQILISNKVLTVRGGYAGVGTPGSYTSDATLTSLALLPGNISRVLYVVNCTTGNLENLTIRNGYGRKIHGTGIYLKNTVLAMRDCLVTENRSDGDNFGPRGAVYVDGGQAALIRCRMKANYGTGSQTTYGGGLYHNAGSLEMRDCDISFNSTVQGPGGGVSLNSSGGARLFNCLIRNNTVKRNSGSGGGIYVAAGAGSVSIENCTVEGNSPGGIRQATGTVGITNSIVWNNGDDVDGTVSLSYSCVEDTNDTGTAVIHTDPKFRKTFYLADDSPCRNVGSADVATVGLSGWYTQTNTADTGTVDLGYHHSAAFAPAKPVLFVDASAVDDSGAGTSWGTAFKTITHALAVAEEGAVIHVAAGTYDTANGELFSITNQTDGVQLLGTNAALTVIDAAGTAKRLMHVRNVGGTSLMSNLTFKGTSVGTGAYPGGCLWLNNTGIQLVDCVVRDTVGTSPGGSGWGSGVGMYVDGGSPVLTGCKIVNNTSANTATLSGGGVYHAAGDLGLRYCVLASNQLVGGSYGSAIYANSAGELNLYNCLISTNRSGATARYGGIHKQNVGPMLLENVTMVGNHGHGINRANGAATVKNSILWGNGIDSTGTVSISYSCIGNSSDYTDAGGNTNVNPAFVDTTYYHLKSFDGNYLNGYFSGGSWSASSSQSPLLDAGDPSSDYLNEPDYNGNRINMGAYGNTVVASKSLLPPRGTVILLR